MAHFPASSGGDIKDTWTSTSGSNITALVTALNSLDAQQKAACAIAVNASQYTVRQIMNGYFAMFLINAASGNQGCDEYLFTLDGANSSFKKRILRNGSVPADETITITSWILYYPK